MTNTLLKTTLVAAVVSAMVTGCGKDEGYDPEFGSDSPLTFENDSINASYDEETGMQTIDLLSGAMVDGTPLRDVGGLINTGQFEFTASPKYRTPEAPANTIGTHKPSPFYVVDNVLQIDTDMFADRLSTCDSTDVWGDKDADNNDIGDGVLDNPDQVVYTITYEIDHGYDYEAGMERPTRQIQLTMNAVYDAVESVTAESAKVALGQDAQLFASVLPTKACAPGLSYDVADTSIATIDSEGNITSYKTGTTTVTVSSTDDPTKSITVDLEVFSAFVVDVTNRDLDANGLPTEGKEVPACVHAGFNVAPTPAGGESLSGDYTYNWTSSNSVDFPVTSSISYGETGVGMFATTAAVGSSFDASVNLATGDTGSFPLEDVETSTVTATVVKNYACDPGTSEHEAGFFVDLTLDLFGAPYKEGWVSAASESLDGAAVQLTGQAGGKTVAHQEAWNKQRNWHSAMYGKGATSVGKQFKYSVWVKLNEVPSETVTIKHVILAWKYEGGPSGPGFDLRRPKAGIHSATLLPTTEWQLVEFIDEASNTPIWSVPEEWNMVTDVFQFWEFYGLAEGNSVIIDDYAIIPVQ